MVYDSEDNMFESDEDDEGLFENINHIVLSKYIVLYSKLPSTFFRSVKENDKQSSNENNTNMNKGVIDNEGVGTDEYSNTDEYKTYEVFIQQPRDKIKANYDNHVDIYLQNWPRKDKRRT